MTINLAGAVTRRIRDALERASADSWNCLTHILEERAMNHARRLDARIAAGHELPPLAGMPFVAKSLFDVQDIPRLAGGPDHPDIAPANHDALLVHQLCDAGAVLVGVADMDEYAYGFLGDNPHRGRVVNPRNPAMMSGGSSSGSAAAVAAGIVPFAIGSDTNGSVRVPAAFCGIFSLKPTYGSLSLDGCVPLANSLDHAGFLASSLDCLEVAWQALTPGGTRQHPPAVIRPGFAGGDYFLLSDATTREGLSVVHSLWADAPVCAFAHVECCLAAASLVTAFEAYRYHQGALRSVPGRYSPAIAQRLCAGGEVNFPDYRRAIKFRSRIRESVLRMMNEARIDVLVAPVSPVEGIAIEQLSVHLADVEVGAGDAAGLFTRPFSLTGFPIVTTPPVSVPGLHDPIPALQLIARPGEEHVLFAFAKEFATRTGPRL